MDSKIFSLISWIFIAFVSSQQLTIDVSPALYEDYQYLNIAPPNPGWEITGGDATASDGGGGVITVPDIKSIYGDRYGDFYGPFSGSGAGIVDHPWFLTQEFYCSSTSSVSVSFFWMWCGDTEADDFTVLHLNDIEQPNTRIAGNFTDWDGTIPTWWDDELSAAADNCGGWNYEFLNFSTNSIPRVNAGELFKVQFEFATSANNEWTTVSDIRIQCTQIPTSSPTMEPTTEPIASQPSTPTNQPSSMPTDQPSINPSDIPTISPSINPSVYPTLIPSSSPSFGPSNTPSMSPSELPSYTPSISPAIVQTAHPSATPTKSITLTPSISYTTTTAPTTLEPTIRLISRYSPSKRPSYAPTLNPTMVNNATDIDVNPDLKQPGNHRDIYEDIDNELVIYCFVALAAIFICCLMVIILRICCQIIETWCSGTDKHGAVDDHHKKIKQSKNTIPDMTNLRSITIDINEENHHKDVDIVTSKATAQLPELPELPITVGVDIDETDNDITDVEEMYNLIKMDEIEMEMEEGDNMTTGGHDDDEIYQNPHTQNIDDWSVEDVISWSLSSTNEILRENVNIFKENKINGNDLKKLHHEHLKELGVTRYFDRLEIIQQIHDLMDY